MIAVEPVVPQNRAEQGRFKKGRSGNPGGRPATVKGFRDRCKEFMDAEGWKQLLELARTPARDQLPALTLIASYAYGKPTQPISGEDGGPVQVRAIDYRAAIAPIAFRSDEDSSSSSEN